MQQAPVMKSSGLAPINDEPVHVFGRNLEERVIESKEEEASPEKKQVEEDKKREQEDDLESIKKRKFDTVTGEEDEETSFQGDFKLFIWDKSSSNWIEKGRGQLKLNDSVGSRQHRSRLIMRTGGTYRIILNVAIQHSCFKVISSTKTSIRFTDSLNVWAASGSNAKQLSDLIEERLSSAAKQAESSNDLKEDEDAKEGAQFTRIESESASRSSQESSREEKDNGTRNKHEETGDAPTQGQNDTSDISVRGRESNPETDNLAERDSNGIPSETVSPKTISEEQKKSDDEDHEERLEDKHRKQQHEEEHQKKELDEKTEQFKERCQNESNDADDADEPAKKIKLSSG